MKFWDFSDFYWSSKAFGKSWDNSYKPCLSLIIAFRFTCGEKKKLGKTSKSLKIFRKWLERYYIIFSKAACCRYTVIWNLGIWNPPHIFLKVFAKIVCHLSRRSTLKVQEQLFSRDTSDCFRWDRSNWLSLALSIIHR